MPLQIRQPIRALPREFHKLPNSLRELRLQHHAEKLVELLKVWNNVSIEVYFMTSCYEASAIERTFAVHSDLCYIPRRFQANMIFQNVP